MDLYLIKPVFNQLNTKEQNGSATSGNISRAELGTRCHICRGLVHHQRNFPPLERRKPCLEP
ncbi:hypothetical protein F2Q68_00010271 [Brassica cretica]|uniref:Uncharacterized protein n=1 Tax=Brassica cretica TaxID=69181 RepID=A0A8S9KR55_BRACR|nr:hypothetical protein F2Q68_00010271 [Brassica cretica]